MLLKFVPHAERESLLIAVLSCIDISTQFVPHHCYLLITCYPFGKTFLLFGQIASLRVMFKYVNDLH